MEVCHEKKLNSCPPPTGYKSFEGLSKLTAGDILTKSQSENFKNDHNKNTGFLQTSPDTDLRSHPVMPLKQQGSVSQTDLAAPSLSSFRETNKDPLSGGPSKFGPWQKGTIPIYAASLITAMAITIALVLQIYLGTNEVYRESVLVTDHKHCTELGQKVLKEQGSSVDCAIFAALCLGIVYPHMSGIGGGGVMLLYDIKKNVGMVINFQETAPSGVLEEMLQNDLELKPGMLVGVPGVLRGLLQAHKLYGRMSWEEVVTRAANVAREGFHVSHSLAEAIAEVKGQKMSVRFRDMFFTGGNALPRGSLLKTPGLAAVLEAGVSEFYNGNLTQEMASEVQANGGVLTVEDITNYTVLIEQPIEGLYQGFRVLVPPPPSVGAALISALNILENFHLVENGTQSAHHWIAESLKAALAMASGLGDPLYTPAVSELIADMLSKPQAAVLSKLINGSHASPPNHYSSVYDGQSGAVASQVLVMGPDDLIVSVTRCCNGRAYLNGPFGSRIVTSSGILLNSQLLDFSWPNKTKESRTNLRNQVQSGKRPLSKNMATIVTPSLGKCGTYVALGSDGDPAVSGITQVLINILFYGKHLNDSLSLGRLHPHLQPSSLLVDSKFLEEDVKALRMKGHSVHRVALLSLVQGAQRTNGIIRGMVDPNATDDSVA